MSETTTETSDGLTWKPLRVFCLYRLALTIILFAGFFGASLTGTTGFGAPGAYLPLAGLYGVFAASAALLAWRWPHRFEWQVRAQVIIDIALIAALLHATDGLESGLGILMVIAVAGGSLLAGQRISAFFAAVATLVLLGQQLLLDLTGRATTVSYTQVALLGLAIFATALTGAFLARRAQENAELARTRGIDIANLEALNEHIVQRLDLGVLAIDPEGDVRLLNTAATELLGAAARPGATLSGFAPRLAEQHDAWRQGAGRAEEPLRGYGGHDFLARFLAIGEAARGGTLIFLEDLAERRAQVQQAKLASLGRLSASIAHEIRNPLGAMLQATQLMEEADYLEAGERRLLAIIGKQGRRLNQTVENVLQLSRREPPRREVLRIDRWLAGFVAEWREQNARHLQPKDRVQTRTEPLFGRFDRSNLEQVIGNLLGNALVHGRAGDSAVTISVRCRPLTTTRAAIEIEDNGPGLDAEMQARLFEPFATGSRAGTGLGLYLARELCEANEAQIDVHEGAEGGALFRITFDRRAMEEGIYGSAQGADR